MKQTHRKIGGRILLLLIFFLLGTAIGCTPKTIKPPLSETPIPIFSITNTFGEDPMKERNFTWETIGTGEIGIIQYVEEKNYTDFNAKTITEQTAIQRESLMLGEMRTLYQVELQGLKPGTVYRYRLGVKGSFSKEATFITASKGEETFHFLTITDFQGDTKEDYQVWKNTLEKGLIQFPKTAFLLLTGDLTDNGDNIEQWDLVIGEVQEVLLTLPVVPLLGNHDVINKDGSNPEGKNFRDRFTLPIVDIPGTPEETVYSFDYGSAHIAVLNTEVSKEGMESQVVWLKKDMVASEKNWKIVALHRGPYGTVHYKDSEKIRGIWPEVFDELGIDLVFQGHEHNYTRSYPLKGGVPVSRGSGTLYVTANSGGPKFYPKTNQALQEVVLQPGTQMFIGVTLSKNSLDLQAYDVKGQRWDQVVLTK